MLPGQLMARGPWCALSVDLDEVDHYRRLYGLPGAESGPCPVYDVALQRIGRFAAEQQLPVTLFAVGDDLRRPASAEGLRRLARRGHLVENHSLGHRYDLSRLDQAAMRREVRGGHCAIEQCTDRPPVGFRAPGYTVTDGLLDVLDDAGYRFDSSVFPCPPYYLAKAAIMASLRLRGRPTAAVLDTPRVWSAPRQPYRPARPWYRPGGDRLLELPILVTPGLRLPLIGQTLLLAGERLARRLLRRCGHLSFVGIELHGVDFLEPADGLEGLARAQRDLRLPLRHKLAVLRGAVAELRAGGGRFVTLAEAAERLGERC